MNLSQTLRQTAAGVACLALLIWGSGAQAQTSNSRLPESASMQGSTGKTDNGSAVPVMASSYVVAPADQLEITVQGHDDLHAEVQVLADGTFNYPVVGPIHAAGLTVAQLIQVLTKGLSDTYNSPQVTVMVRDSHVRKISIAGAVRSPGQYDYRPGLRLLELIAACGGPVQAPELTQVTLVTEQGTKTIPIDLVKLMAGADPSLNTEVAPGDMLLMTPRDPAQAMVQIVGQVDHPGQFPVAPEGATIISLITAAGGAAPNAALTHVQLMHAGKIRTLDLHPTLYNMNDPVGATTVVAGDTISVPLNNAKVAILGEVHGPNVYYIPDGETLPVTTALAMAGGPTSDGDKRQVGIRRMDKHGKPVIIALNLDDLLAAKASAPDINLQPGDILVVPTRRRKQSLGDYISQVPGLYYVSKLLTGL